MSKTLLIICVQILVIAGVGAHILRDHGNGFSRQGRRQRDKSGLNFRKEEISHESEENSSGTKDEQSTGSGHSIDEVLSDALKSANGTNPPGKDEDQANGKKKIELDIILTPAQLAALYPNGRTKRNAINIQNQLWPDKTIVYRILPGHFSAFQTKRILQAMKKWSKHTCLIFRKKTFRDRHYVKIYNGTGGCYSYVGYIHEEGQDLGLAPRCVQKAHIDAVVIHEIGHAIGMFHEHTRPDRKNFVTVLPENIEPGAESQFEIRHPDIVDNHGTRYDYRSIMHYSRKVFSFNGEDTIRTKDPAYANIIGRTNTFSFLDAYMVNSMYNCAEGCGFVRCPPGGYQGKDCKCYCPANDGADIVLCTEATTTTSTTSTSTTTTQPTTTTPPSTTTRTSTTTTTTLPTTTSTSTQPTTTTTTPTTTTTTTTTPDSQDFCMDYWHTQRCIWNNFLGKCRKSEFVRSNCELTCGLCYSKYGPVCKDNFPGDICDLISRFGMCMYYAEDCEKACGVC